jgi:hypothetical protein
MNSPFADDLINAANEDIPTAIPGLIDAAVAAFDADRDTSRRYLLRASALLDRYEPIGMAPHDPDWADGQVEQTLTTSNLYNASKLRHATPSLWRASDQRERFNVDISVCT